MSSLLAIMDWDKDLPLGIDTLDAQQAADSLLEMLQRLNEASLAETSLGLLPKLLVRIDDEVRYNGRNVEAHQLRR